MTSKSIAGASFFLEDLFWDHPVNALGPVYKLRNSEINRNTSQHVSMIGAQLFLCCQEINRLAGGELGSQRQVFVQSHDDVVRRRLRPRPLQVQVFTHHELER